MPSKNRTHVSIRKETKQRIDDLCQRLMTAYEAGQTDIEFCEQGTRGEWVSPDTLINKLIDQYEGHRERSRRSQRKRSTSVTN